MLVLLGLVWVWAHFSPYLIGLGVLAAVAWLGRLTWRQSAEWRQNKDAVDVPTPPVVAKRHEQLVAINK